MLKENDFQFHIGDNAIMRPSSYNTKQGEAVLSYIASLQGKHVTVEQIAAHFEKEEINIGVTTIYRHLDKLVAGGEVRKYIIDGVAGACYQYAADEPEPDRDHFHLKCESCGQLFHLQCDMLDELARHVAQEHDFQINPMKTVFYGKCEACLHND